MGKVTTVEESAQELLEQLADQPLEDLLDLTADRRGLRANPVASSACFVSVICIHTCGSCDSTGCICIHKCEA